MKIFGLAMTVIGASIIAFGGHSAQAHHKPTMVVVHQGQTLWGICSDRAPKGEDVREYVYQVEQVNHLGDSDTLQPGEILRLP